jgi:hypothetical protein
MSIIEQALFQRLSKQTQEQANATQAVRDVLAGVGAESQVQHDGKMVTYRSADETKKITQLAVMANNPNFYTGMGYGKARLSQRGYSPRNGFLDPTDPSCLFDDFGNRIA